MFNLRAKFFVTILLVNVILALGLYLFLKFSFENSFTNYVSQRERDTAERLAAELEVYYQDQGDWQAFRERPEQWAFFLRDHFRPSRRGFDRNRPTPSPRDFDERNRERLEQRPSERRDDKPGEPSVRSDLIPLFLLEDDHSHIVGLRWPEDQSFLRPLNVSGNVVGYLGVPIRPEMRDYLDQQFAEGQGKNLIVIIAATFFVALAIAIPLSYLLVNRIAGLVRYVQQLSLGQYKQPLQVKGKDELSTLAEHLKNLGNTLSKSEQQRNQWVADISHELRTPVAILRADLEAMEDGVRSLDAGSVNRLQKHVLRLRNLIEDLRSLSLSDLGSMAYRKEGCDLNVIVSEAVELMEQQFQQQNLTLNFTDHGSPLIVLGDSQRLTQLFLNLLQNSLNYTDSLGQVVVSISQSNDRAVVEISDSAPGVDTKLHSRLTERLFRVDSSRSRNSGGAGLGLSLCANIVAAHDGHIEFTDSTLGGLRVIISIPLIKSNPD